MTRPEIGERAGAELVSDVEAPPQREARIRRMARLLSPQRISGLYLWALMIVIYSLATSTFLTVTTARTIANGQAVTAIVALGLTVALAAGVFDLSIGGVLGLANIIVARLLAQAHWSIPIAIVATLLLMSGVGLVNGLLVVYARIDPFIATLGTSSLLSAAIFIVSENQNILGIPISFQNLAGNQVLGMPIVMYYVIALALILYYVLEWTPLGRRLYATGGNREVARLAGVRTNRYVIGSFICSATVAAAAGVLLVATLGSGSTEVGPSYLLPAFAAGFLGATQIHPGRFNVWGTTIAIYLLATGVQGLVLLGAATWVPDAFNGVALLLAVGIANFQRRTRASAKPPAAGKA